MEDTKIIPFSITPLKAYKIAEKKSRQMHEQIKMYFYYKDFRKKYRDFSEIDTPTSLLAFQND